MALSDYQREQLLAEKLIAKYGPEYGLSMELVDKVFSGGANDAELNAYTAGSDKLVMRFKNDLRTVPLADYTDQDVDLVIALADANHRYAEAGTEQLSKVIPTGYAQKLLNAPDGAPPPALSGFAALSRHSENLSPQQTISQFGLDYAGTPYLSQEGTDLVKQPYLFQLETPIDPALQKNAKLPLDPRLLSRIERLAAASPDPEQQGRARQFLDTYRDKLTLIVRGTADDAAKVAAQHPDYPVKLVDDRPLAQQGPYLGNTAPLYGDQLARSNPYAAIVQENYLDEKTPIAKGAKLYAKFPRAAPGVDPDRSDLPAGSEKVEVARWDGSKWQPQISPKELDARFERALKTIPAGLARERYRKSAEDFRTGLPIKLPRSVEQRLKSPEHKDEVKRKLSHLSAGTKDLTPPKKKRPKHPLVPLRQTPQGKRIARRREEEQE